MAVAEVVAGVACSSDLHPSSLSASPVLVPPPSLTDVLLGLAGPVPVQSKRVSQKVQACHSRARITISPAYRTNLASAQRVVPYGPWNSASNQCRNPAESPPHSWSAFRRFRPRPAPPATFTPVRYPMPQARQQFLVRDRIEVGFQVGVVASRYCLDRGGGVSMEARGPKDLRLFTRNAS